MIFRGDPGAFRHTPSPPRECRAEDAAQERDFARALAESLEVGAWRGRLASALERAWSAIASARLRVRLTLPPDARVIGIGGATLGGAGKTPVAIELARSMRARGEGVALVSHAYRARRVSVARVVAPADVAADVGDDALFAARALAPAGVPVVVAPSRTAALVLAASLAPTVFVDGLLQTSPRPLRDAVLILDAATSLMGASCPPRGDLRAPLSALFSAADLVAVLAPPTPDLALDPAVHPPPPSLALPVPSVALASRVDQAFSPLLGELPLRALARVDVGVVLGIAHPERVLSALGAAGIEPRIRVVLGDHARFGPRVREALAARRVDVWLTTARCATKLPETLGGAPVLALRHEIDVAPLLAAIDARA